jgi:selenocysteine lyase/cysteine desulfurase
MPATIGQDDLATLARAFDLAWEGYYCAARTGAISKEAARPALANFLVARAKEGIVEEATLAIAGLAYLISLTPEVQETDSIVRTRADQLAMTQSWNFNLNDANARFTDQWIVRIGRSA